MRLPHNTITTALLVAAASTEPVHVKAPTVDLGYAVYEGSHDTNNSIDVFKG
jgi:hypothetical protein